MVEIEGEGSAEEDIDGPYPLALCIEERSEALCEVEGVGIEATRFDWWAVRTADRSACTAAYR